MHGLFSETVEVSSDNLFGDSLNSSIKEVSELNRLKTSLTPRGGFRGRSFKRGRPFIRGRSRVFRGQISRSSSRRFVPYNKRRITKPALNQAGPSK